MVCLKNAILEPSKNSLYRKSEGKSQREGEKRRAAEYLAINSGYPGQIVEGERRGRLISGRDLRTSWASRLGVRERRWRMISRFGFRTPRATHLRASQRRRGGGINKREEERGGERYE